MGDKNPVFHRLQSPQQLAYEYLREAIVSGRLPGGARLKSEAIAEMLGVSRMPVRDALRQLDGEGLVTIRPNRGAIVTNLTPDDILELFEMRAALEGLAGRLASLRTCSDALETLRDDLARMERSKPNHLVWMVEHDRFHDRLCGLSGRPRLCAQITTIRQQIHPYFRLYAASHVDPEIAGHQHSAILKSLEHGNPDQVERVVRDHVMTNGEEIVETLKKMLPHSEAPDPAPTADRLLDQSALVS